jgi:hypothetical protein
MKTTLTRTLLVTLLATSISAFAKSGDAKSNDAATPSNAAQQNDCNRRASDAGKQSEQPSSDEQKIEQQDKDWLHDLQGAYGG